MSGERQASPLVHSVSALLAGVAATTVTHPLDLVKARFQVQHVQRGTDTVRYRSVRQAFGLIVREEGWRGLYRGLAPNVIGNGAAWGIYMFWYQTLKKLAGGNVDGSFVLAGMAGAGTALVRHARVTVALLTSFDFSNR